MVVGDFRKSTLLPQTGVTRATGPRFLMLTIKLLEAMLDLSAPERMSLGSSYLRDTKISAFWTGRTRRFRRGSREYGLAVPDRFTKRYFGFAAVVGHRDEVNGGVHVW